MMSAGILLGLAIATEVLGTVFLRVSDGFTKVLPASVTVVAYVTSVILLAKVLKELDIGLTYAIWAGAGTAAVAVIGVAVWHEPMDALKVASIAAVILGVVGLNVSGAH
jgi:small multidrug resistance pump